MNKYFCDVSISILGPFLTAASSPYVFGIDKSFHRNRDGKLVIPASHIKGKLRMSLEEIAGFISVPDNVSLEWLFGAPSATNTYEPLAGRMKNSDFEIDASASNRNRTRTAIDSISGTAAEHQLRVFEDAFPSGQEITCTGKISFQAEDQPRALEITNVIRIGFLWLTNMGSEKGVGFGRLKTVQVGPPKMQDHSEGSLSLFVSGETLNIRIKPIEPIATGGVQKRRTNYSPSEKILTGGLIKGALAAALNRAHGIEPVFQELSEKTAKDYPGYENLVANFSLIRVSHALPAYNGDPRPVKLPISIAQIEKKLIDTTISLDPYPMVDDRAPVYFIDWKTPQEYYGFASPDEIYISHTEIDDISRRSLHGNLFTESYLCPNDGNGKPIEWICNVDFWQIEDPTERNLVANEFARAMQLHFDGLGKENHRVEIILSEGYAVSALESNAINPEDFIFIALQSDALMLEPQKVRELSSGEDLQSLYTAFWNEITSDGKNKPCMQLVDFYAHQSFKGGYLYHRYLGSAERTTKPNQYHPYYLTNAGSVFKLQVLDLKRTLDLLEKWKQQGLDMPTWAKVEYGQYQRSLWKNCPFVPENGYGEIKINLNCQNLLNSNEYSSGSEERHE